MIPGQSVNVKVAGQLVAATIESVTASQCGGMTYPTLLLRLPDGNQSVLILLPGQSL